jgi:hypothetical protein
MSRKAAVRSVGVGSSPMTARAKSRPHTAHVHAWTRGAAGVSCTPSVAPQCGHASLVGSVTVDWSSSVTGHPQRRDPGSASGCDPRLEGDRVTGQRDAVQRQPQRRKPDTALRQVSPADPADQRFVGHQQMHSAVAQRHAHRARASMDSARAIILAAGSRTPGVPRP